MYAEEEENAEAMEAYAEEFAKVHDQWKAEYAKAREQHPHACVSCGGSGAVYSTYDPSPSGVSLGAGWFMDVDPCPDCLDQDKCPRCGSKMADEDSCSACDWTTDDMEPVLPPEPEF